MKREDLFVTSKLWCADFANPEDAIKLTLKNLQLEYIDLYIIHWPSGYWSGKTPLHVLWPKLESLVEQKLTRSIGVSNFNVQLIADLLTYAKIKPAVNQVELNPLNPQTELVKFLKDQDIQPVAYCPVAKANNASFVTGKSGTQNSPDLQVDEDVKKIAAKHNKTPL